MRQGCATPLGRILRGTVASTRARGISDLKLRMPLRCQCDQQMSLPVDSSSLVPVHKLKLVVGSSDGHMPTLGP